MSDTIVSLAERRKARNKEIAQSTKKDTTRLTELEAELSKVIDILGDLEQQLRAQDRYLHRLLSLLKKQTEARK